MLFKEAKFFEKNRRKFERFLKKAFPLYQKSTFPESRYFLEKTTIFPRLDLIIVFSDHIEANHFVSGGKKFRKENPTPEKVLIFWKKGLHLSN